ncbi:MAG: hypothetical protein LQ340_004263 [Diploschistes diacapsis]|nr:MAG: hypothetical protein LQ340_004263 [Diploschistes diacapsis]
MASVFTYDPDPPRISSPWSGTPVSTSRMQDAGLTTHGLLLGGLLAPPPSLLSGLAIVKLEAEPQDGPTEYKLHLLLRSRRSFSSISTGSYLSGSYQSRTKLPPLKAGSKIANRGFSSLQPPPQARQKRLEHLTTQLLWRLQQSSPFHSSSAVKLVPPALPETGPVLGPPAKTGRLLPGLEDSRGALYEIGVSDDGVFAGLTRDEMDESLINLRAMSASLGCKVEILRTVIVGDCEWTDTLNGTEGSADLVVETLRTEKLWVVEALVLPDTNAHSSKDAPTSPLDAPKYVTPSLIKSRDDREVQIEDSHTEQLRVSLTGATTSGKSSLVGTLSTSALDSGRGKTRLNLLKHRHEIESGITSSVAPELIGYRSQLEITGSSHVTSVVNYGCGNVSSWNDVHNTAEGERLVFLVDSAGHPRYKRTTVRGLVSWAPHWTLCCIAADEEGDAGAATAATVAGREGLGGSVAADADPSRAHLELCLKLGLPLIVVITKLDAATNQGLRNNLSKVLSTIKAYGRNPVVLRPDPTPRLSEELRHIPVKEEEEVRSVLQNNDTDGLVPIVFTSAVKGGGILKLHALLRHLPIPRGLSGNGVLEALGPLNSVFHVDEIFSRVQTAQRNLTGEEIVPRTGFILSGHLSYNDLAVGDACLLGPFATDHAAEVRPLEISRARSYPVRLSSSPTTKLSHSDPRPHSYLDAITPNHARLVSEDTSSTDRAVTASSNEWVVVRIVSIRNLRLPLLRLLAGQVGTVGVEFTNGVEGTEAAPKLRKGMVLIRQNSTHREEPTACSGFKAVFPAEDYRIMEPAAAFDVYIASVRASGRIVSVEALDADTASLTSLAEPSPTDSLVAGEEKEEDDDDDEEDSLFMFDTEPQTPAVAAQEGEYSFPPRLSADTDKKQVRNQPAPPKNIEVVFHFVGSREWVEAGRRVLVMPKTVADGVSGLEGFVGQVSGLLFAP